MSPSHYVVGCPENTKSGKDTGWQPCVLFTVKSSGRVKIMIDRGKVENSMPVHNKLQV